eukprot:COSAG06_NODE_1586_length_9011_cov_83.566652_5_plen_127_part_00
MSTTQAEPYGLCKVVPPAGWAPSWPIDSENFRFQTRIQNVHQLQERGEFAFWKQLKESLARHNKPLKVDALKSARAKRASANKRARKARGALKQLKVRKTPLFAIPFCTKNDHFDLDRLGTNIRKT